MEDYQSHVALGVGNFHSHLALDEFVVVEELVPEAAEGEQSDIGTIGFAVGFVLMMIMDVALG